MVLLLIGNCHSSKREREREREREIGWRRELRIEVVLRCYPGLANNRIKISPLLCVYNMLIHVHVAYCTHLSQ